MLRKFGLAMIFGLMASLTYAQQSTPIPKDDTKNLQSCPDGEYTCSNGEVVHVARCGFASCSRCKGHPDGPTQCKPLVDALSNWMGNSDDYQSRSLMQLTVPATHDSGMWNVKNVEGDPNCTIGGTFANTLTQHLDIAQQLKAGVRNFDIRVMVARLKGSYEFYTYHGPFVEGVYFGCLGGRMDTALDQIRTFVEEHPKEVVLVEISHMRHISWIPGNFSKGAIGGDANATDKKAAVNLVMDRLGAKMIKPGNADLASVGVDRFDGITTFLNMPLKDLTRFGNVLITYGDSDDALFPPDQGFYKKTSALIYDKYSDTNDIEVLRKGGKNNEKTEVNSQTERTTNAMLAKDKYVYLDWTLTQTTAQAVECGLSTKVCGKASIEGMSKKAHKYISELDGYYSETGLPPHVISLDFVTADTSRTIISWNAYR